MPISDLLASINGQPLSTTTVPRPFPRPVSSPSLKRKAEHEIPRETPKVSRPLPRTTLVPTQSSKPADRPLATPKSIAQSRDRTGVVKSGASSDMKRPSATTPKPATTKPTSNGNSPAPGSRPVQAQPKKGSFAEILARGRQAHAKMGQVGVLQHKKVEKGSVFKKKDANLPNDNHRPPSTAERKTVMSGGYKGSARPGYSSANGGKDRQQLGGQRGHPTENGARQLPNPGRGKARSDAAAAAGASFSRKVPNGSKKVEEEPKKIKKAATATTGYTGTSRPRPATSAKRRDQPRGGALLNPPRQYGSSSRRSRRDDYYDDDEDMDDFIDYDEEEDQGGPRYDYASDESSDMEAGMDDIDDEERRAERIARQEDIQEERLERNLKMAKEERKRKALEELRAGRRR